jgi:lipoate-protein ligase B
MAYRAAHAMQLARVAELKAAGGAGHEWLLTVEHDPVITLGRRARPEHILATPAELARAGIDRVEVERGGDVTYHGPGQLVAYPVLDLRRHRRDVAWYSQTLLGVVVDTLADHGIAAEARGGEETGVWVGDEKIGALGVKIERWVTYHGVALNIDPDLSHFDWIVPCGLHGRKVTSVAAVLGRAADMRAVRASFTAAFADRFGVLLAPSDGAATLPETIPLCALE